MNLEFAGTVFAVVTVASIAAGHHLVRKLNYHFGTKPALPLFILGTLIFGLSFLCVSELASGILGIVGLTTIVDGVEIIKQEKRISKGHAPMNPNRPIPRAATATQPSDHENRSTNGSRV